MCGKTTSTTANTTNSLPPEITAAYNNLFGLGSTIAQQPLQQYGGSTVAGFTPDQESAFRLAEQGAGAGVPWLNQSADLYSQGAAPTFGQVPQYSAENLQPYMDPYNQNVIDTTLANIQRSDAISQNQLRDQGILSGAAGTSGDRAGVAAAELARGQALARNKTIADLTSSGFKNAQGAFQGQQQVALQGLGADANRQIQAAGGVSGLAQLLQSLGSGDINNLLKTGTMQQQLGQQQLQVPYQQFQEQQQYPFKIADFMSSLLSGQKAPTSSSTTTTQPGPNFLSQIAGLGLGILGLPGSSVFGGLLSGLGLNKGGRVPAMAGGGGVQVDPGLFKVPVGNWYTPSAPAGAGLHTGSQAYINALPQVDPASMPPPRVTQLPPGIRTALSRFPGFVSNTTPSPNPIGTPPAGRNQFLDWLRSMFGGMARGGLADGGYPTGFDPEWDALNPDAVPPSGETFKGPLAVKPPVKAPEAPVPAIPPEVAAAAPAPGISKPPTKSSVPTGLGKGSGKISPLLYAGLGIMASKSPFPLSAIGEGSLAGLQAYGDQQKSLDANAIKFTGEDGNIWIYYPGTKEKVNLGIPADVSASELVPVVNDKGEVVYGRASQSLGKPVGVKNPATGRSPLGDLMAEKASLQNQLQALKAANPSDPRIPQLQKALETYDADILKTTTSSPGTIVNVGEDGSRLPTPSAGTVYAKDPKGDIIYEDYTDPTSGKVYRRPREVPIGGGPKDLTKQQGIQDVQSLISTSTVATNVDDALSLLEDPTWNTGLLGGLTNAVPGSPAYNLQQKIEGIRPSITIDRLNAIRNSNPTGGAFGNITNFEDELLGNSFGSLKTGQDPKDIAKNLNRVRNIYADAILAGFGGGKLYEIGQKIKSGAITHDQGIAAAQAIIDAPSPGYQKFLTANTRTPDQVLREHGISP